MRFVWAVMALVLATLLIGAGVAQRTVLLGPKTQQIELSVENPTPYTVIDGAVLRAREGTQTLLVRGEGDIFVAYGRTTDMRAWLADARHNVVMLDEQGEFDVTTVAAQIAQRPEVASTPEPEPEDAAAADGEDPADAERQAAVTSPRDPAGSDLWLDEYTERDAVVVPLQLPEGMSVLIARDGVQNAPSDIVVSWPQDNSTPWVGPMVVGGSLLMLLGVLLYIHAIRFQRRGKGPRRKGPGPLPPTEPISKVFEPAAIGPAIESTDLPAQPQTRRSRRNLRLALPALGLSTLLLAGCSPDFWPRIPEAPEPSPSATVVAPENQQAPAVTESQAAGILRRLAATIAEADETRDADLLALRMSGAPLQERLTDYALRAKIEDRALPAAIPTDRIRILLPQAQEAWPRTVLLLAEDATDTATAPVILILVQDDPWQAYRVTYLAEMQAAAELPDLAPAWLGGQLVPPDSPFLRMPPENLAAAFAEVVDTGAASEYFGIFDEATLALVDSIVASREGVVTALADHGAAKTSKVEFEMRLSGSAPISLSTLDSGAIVAIDLIDWEKVAPTTSFAVIELKNEEAKALTGVGEAAKGVETTYSLQLFFAMPSTGSTDPIRLLAVHQKLLSVEVIR